MKECSKCKIKKEDSDFNTDNSKKDRLYSICKQCRSKKKYKIKKVFDKNLKKSIIYAIKKNKKNLIWEKILCFTLDDLKAQLEENFTSEMSWNNFGLVWGICFIIPKNKYIYKSPISNEFKKCWNLKNFTPKLKTEYVKGWNKIHIKTIEEKNLFGILPSGVNLLTKE